MLCRWVIYSKYWQSLNLVVWHQTDHKKISVEFLKFGGGVFGLLISCKFSNSWLCSSTSSERQQCSLIKLAVCQRRAIYIHIHTRGISVPPVQYIYIEDCEGWWLSGCHSSLAAQARCPASKYLIRLLVSKFLNVG